MLLQLNFAEGVELPEELDLRLDPLHDGLDGEVPTINDHHYLHDVGLQCRRTQSVVQGVSHTVCRYDHGHLGWH